MKKIIILVILLFLTVLIGFGSVSLAKDSGSNPVEALIELLQNSQNATQMESFSGSISLGDDPIVLEFDEIRHISLSLKFETFDSDVSVNMVAHIGGDSLHWYGHTASAENNLTPNEYERNEIDTDYLTIDVYQHGPGELEGTLYYNITTTYPATP